MKEITRKYALDNGDLVITEIRHVKDEKYRDGRMYTFRCMSADGKTLFAVENSHGKPHIHWKGKKEEIDCDCNAAWAKFDELLRAYRNKIERGL